MINVQATLNMSICKLARLIELEISQKELYDTINSIEKKVDDENYREDNFVEDLKLGGASLILNALLYNEPNNMNLGYELISSKWVVDNSLFK